MADEKQKEILSLPIREGEEPWTEEEIAEVRAELIEDVERMGKAVEAAEAELNQLMDSGADGNGRDPADVGSSNYERDQGVSLAHNVRGLYEQSQLARSLLESGKYGYCEVCGEPIGKARLQAFPRATLCVACKQREERR